MIERSPWIVGEHLPGPIVGRHLRALQAAHPGQLAYSLRVRVPAPGGQPTLHVYRWTPMGPALRVVRADRPGGAYELAGAHLDGLEDGSVPLDASRMTWCDPDSP